MFYNCLCLTVFIIIITYSNCFVNYELFQGFDNYTISSTEDTLDPMTPLNKTNITASSKKKPHTSIKHWIKLNKSISDQLTQNEPASVDFDPNPLSSLIAQTTPAPPQGIKRLLSPFHPSAIQTLPSVKEPSVKLKNFNHDCPEKENPFSLGTYEIPTEKDLILFTKRTLSKMFNSYNEKTLMLLNDIKEATKASTQYQKHCTGQNKKTYMNCVRRISKKCITVTKDLVAVLQVQKQTVRDIIEGTICSLKEVKTDPVELVKTLAMDEAALEFALPAFLRLIGKCSTHCSVQANQMQNTSRRRRPLRHMTDQDLVVKNLLTKKNYIELITNTESGV